MDNKLSKPVAYDYQIASACIADGHNENGKWVDWNNKLTRHCPPDWMMEEGKVTGLKLLYSQEYVSSLKRESAVNGEAAASLNIENQELKKRIAELEAKLATPVRLPERYSIDCGVCADPNGDWLNLPDVIATLLTAGFTVSEE